MSWNANWHAHGGNLFGDPIVAQNKSGLLEAFVRSKDR